MVEQVQTHLEKQEEQELQLRLHLVHMVNHHLEHITFPVAVAAVPTKREIREEMAVSAEVAEAVIDKTHLLQVQRELQTQAVAEEHVVFLQALEQQVVAVSL